MGLPWKGVVELAYMIPPILAVLTTHLTVHQFHHSNRFCQHKKSLSVFPAEDFVVRRVSVEILALQSSFCMIFGLTSLNSLCVSLCLIIVAKDTADRHAMDEGHRALHAIALSTPFHSRNHPWVF